MLAFFMFVCSCIFSVIRNWWPTICHFLVYLFVPNQLSMFRAMVSPIISRCHGRDETPFHLVHNTGRQQHSWTISEAVNTVKYSWWWAKPSPETWRADWVQINKPKICIFVFISYELYDGFVLRIWATSFDISTWRLWIHLLPPCCSFEVKLISTNMLRPNPQNSI